MLAHFLRTLLKIGHQSADDVAQQEEEKKLEKQKEEKQRRLIE